MIKQTPITVLTGYLGAGKTTLINNVLNDPQNMKIAVIVNDIGEVNIDSELISSKGHASVVDDSLVELTNGCICCNLNEDLINQITKIIEGGKFDYILIEASGICEPRTIAESILTLEEMTGQYENSPICRLDGIISVVDAFRLLTEFSGGRALLEADQEDIEQLLVEQIEFCNLILLNKTDLLSKEDLGRVEAIIKVIQPTVKIVETTYTKIPTTQILNQNIFDYNETFRSAGWAREMEKEYTDDNNHNDNHHDDHGHGDHDHDCHNHEEHDHKHNSHDHSHHHHHHDHNDHSHMEEYGIETFIYKRRKPFSDEKLEAWVHDFPENVIRCKGIVWIDFDEELSYVLEQAGQSVTVAMFGRWLAAASEEERERIWEEDPQSKESWDEKCGDRMTKLVFIGINIDKQAICDSLDECLVQ